MIYVETDFSATLKPRRSEPRARPILTVLPVICTCRRSLQAAFSTVIGGHVFLLFDSLAGEILR
jgi:hypothetical protein